MVKWVLIFWALPVGFLCLWYGLSYYDLNFGMMFFSRKMHDIVFEVYGNALGLPASDVPPLVARAMIIDSLLVFTIIAWRKRAPILGWWRGQGQAHPSKAALLMDDNLSNAP